MTTARTDGGRAKLAAIAVGLRDFMAERVKDSTTQSLQTELDMGTWRWPTCCEDAGRERRRSVGRACVAAMPRS